MMTWEIFLGIVALIGFVISVMTPIIKLNTSITKLNVALTALQTSMDRIEDENTKSHRRIWSHNDNQDALIENHERRLSDIEHTMDVTEKLHPELVGLRVVTTPTSVDLSQHLNHSDSEQQN